VRGALAEPDSARRLVLLPIVQRATARQEVVACLDDADANVRAAACAALSRMGAVDALPRLFERLADSNRRVVQAATAAIQSLGSTQAQTLTLEAAEDPRPSVRRSAIQILGYFGFPGSLPVFVAALDDGDLSIREASLQGLALLEAPAALDAVLTASQDTEDKVRSAAMRSLGNAVLQDPRIEVRLREGLSDVSAWVRYFAVQALGRRAHDAAAEAIAALLEDPAGQVRVAAVEALSHLSSEHARRSLRTAATSADVEMQRAALIGLGLSGHPESVPLLLAAAESDSAPTRLLALSVLAEHAPQAALAALRRAVDDSNEDVSSAAAGFLGALPLPEATRALVELISQPAHRERALSLLSKPAPNRVSQLLRSLPEADEVLAPLLAATLARLRDGDARDALLHALTRGNVAARQAAAAALAATGEQRALVAVAAAAHADADAAVRQLCAILVSR
ncbi:MAG: HEAT repeat domain-containing protein, partial [Archangium sp.]